MNGKKEKKLLNDIFNRNIMAIIIPYIILSVLIVSFVFSNIVKDIEKRNDKLANYITKSLESVFEDSEAEMRSIAFLLNHDIERHRDSNEISDLISESLSEYSRFQHIEVIDENNKIMYASHNNPKRIDVNHICEADFVKNLNNGEYYWSKTFICEIDQEPIIILGYKKDKYTYLGHISLKFLQMQFDADEETIIAITDKSGNFIYNDDIDYVSQKKIEPYFDMIKASIISGKDSVEIHQGNIKYNIHTVSINRVNWYLLIYESFESLYTTTYSLIAILGILLLLIIATYIILSKMFNKKIESGFDKFLKQTQLISEGKFQYIHAKQSYTEFSNLQDSFNLMTTKILERDRQLKEYAYTDDLTGLYNRNYLYKELWDDYTVNGYSSMGLIFFDIDNFKHINDTYGHNIGDYFLKSISSRIESVLEPSSTLVRFGGDEFIILVPDNQSNIKIDLLVSRINEVLTEPLDVHSIRLTATASFGASFYPMHSENLDDMIKYADIAMYEAKKKGKDQLVYFDFSMADKINRHVQIDYHLKRAQEKNELYLVFQPQINAGTGKIRGFEALIRWKNEDIGVVSPLEFISIAEESGYMKEIGRFVAKTAVESIKEINNQFNSNYTMSINVSPEELIEESYYSFLKDLLEECDLDEQCLEIEITENVVINSVESVNAMLAKIKSLGVKIALDDFGTGYSSLAYMDELPIDLLKIDQHFIKEIDQEEKKQKMLEVIIPIAKSLDLLVVAEGVEKVSHVEYLANSNCDIYQGYYYSRPLTFEECIQYIKNNG